MANNLKKMTLNNFDIIRLFAALQVALTHTISHLNIQLPINSDFLSFFPGVPIFFFISGYLIYSSYSNILNNKLLVFFTNRILRLYPALLLCFLITLSSLFLSGYALLQPISLKDYLLLGITSLTFFQFYNPDFLRAYGVGVINGSLWTISVEIQFYILTPIIFYLYKKYKNLSYFMLAIFLIANILNTFFNAKDTIVLKLISASFIPWIYLFMVGAYISKNTYLKEKILRISLFKCFIFYLSAYFFIL